MSSTAARGVACALALVLAAGCGTGGSARPTSTAAPTAAGPVAGTVTVFAAASLSEVFPVIAEEYSARHPGATVTFSFGSSATLARQVADGAPADVFAAASEATMSTATAAGAAPAPVAFATNTLQIAVPPGNPGRVRGLADFADPDRTIALCAPQVPCGAAAERVFAAAGVTPRPDTLESDVKATLSKVELDEVDAALVYTTDVRAAGGRVEGIAVPEAAAAVNVYPVAALTEAPNPVAARAFVDQVLSPEGRAVLEAAGFGRPS